MKRKTASFLLLQCILLYHGSTAAVGTTTTLVKEGDDVNDDSPLDDQKEESCSAEETFSTTHSSTVDNEHRPLATTTTTSSTTGNEAEEECQDSNPSCPQWADLSECETNPQYMKHYCRLSCGTCHDKSYGGDEAPPVQEDGISSSSSAGTSSTSSSMGVPQVLDGESLGISQSKIQETIDHAWEYMTFKVDAKLLELCRNHNELCAVWAAMGECTANPRYMQGLCAPVCQSCHLVTIEGRCPVDPNAPVAWEPGSLNQMFERLTSEPYLSNHNVQILSSPQMDGDGEAAGGGPWIITMDDIITSEEAERLIELGDIEGYKESVEVDKLQADGTLREKKSEHRTSYNAWCQNDCYKDEVALRVIHRLSNLTGIDEANSEHLQLLRYHPGQYYLPHHDYIPTEVERQQGPRILTVFLYLNDVEEGGETEFVKLGPLQVAPKKYRVLIWPNVLDEAPNQVDYRTRHQAKTVKAGVKYGANAWFHMHDFKTSNRIGCQ